jgi:chromosome segregation ATPase
MEEVNYNDKVVLPFLEKKCKDLLSLNLVFEAKLLIEQNKVKDFESFANQENEKVEGLVNQIENLKLNIENINKSIGEYTSARNDAVNQLNQLQQDMSNLNDRFVREESMKNNAIGEYDILRNRFSAIEVENSELKKTINESKELNIKYSALEFENSELKKTINESKVKKQKVAV